MRNSIIDLECAGLPEAAEYLEAVSAPSNYKDPEKIAAYIKAEQEKQLERVALDIDLCQIVAAGIWPEDHAEPIVFCGLPEEDIIREVRELILHDDLIGFNLFGYDALVLMRRAQYLGINFPRINIDRYRSPHTDLMQELSFRGAVKYRGLKFYSKRFNLGVPDDDEDGSKVAAWVAANNWDAVSLHLRRDLERTKALAERLGYWTPTAKPEPLETF